ncbi:GMC family oxidoreductase N-terminal domain-containing protein [Siccirubricoccus sp. KC 17139]|uniref:GMC family oxidoreductase N-terminal domain-containing protein n=1 Tax=Siccirubricoccus soli TaxID=2899147 RepID=A0ABT1CZ71_9PROT|nr:GMC family oxidoreductase N-terminal domain-containing protein [Siccirubricoccus soli]MCO6414963.1 GMC family oxidoreductase N-terminal domain-containing protein [Siccirubricoccus soli]MCP2681094.1 GMC family oxidoreductase N-terminal domain-containing protein [Siccirubricoccus soli]
MEFDYVIAGAGSAGCVLANRLSASGATVAVIEAGGSDRHPWIHIPAGYAKILDHPRLTWGYRTAPDEGTAMRALDYPRGKVWGGCSSINGLGHVRGHPSDYDLWAQKGCTGWGWDDLLPYFRRHESFAGGGEGRGAEGPQPVEHLAEVPELLTHLGRAAAAIGLPVLADMNGPEREGFAPFQQTRRGRRRVSAARAYLVPALRRPNLTLLDNALALRVVVEDGRAAGIAIRRDGAEQVIRARREVVLAAGAIGSPQLLMLSGFGPGAALQAMGIPMLRDMPGIGANLQDHYIIRLGFRLGARRLSANHRIAGWRLPLEALRWAAKGDGVLTWSPGMFSLFARTAPGLEAPDIQINGGPLSWAPLPPEPGRRFGGIRIGVPEAEPGMTLGVWQCRPESRGSVTLASPDPAAAPMIAPRYLATEGDRACVLRGLRLARRWMAAAPLRGIVAGETRPGPAAESDAELLDFARETGGTVYHPCGTVRMGGDPTAPLDAALRLRGVAGLRVADASAFPDIPVCNINATVLSLAEKAADLILSAGRG